MVTSKAFRLLPFAGLLSLSVVTVLGAFQPSTQAQTPEASEEAPVAQSQEGSRPLSSSLLSVQGGQRLMDEAGAAVSAQNYDQAISKLQEARQVFNQLSNFYQELAASFAGIDNRIAEEQRNQAFEAAQMRDEATYQLALVHRAQNKPELAVPLLVQIIRSQNPTRDLGQRAYQQLFELGFVDSQYPRNSDESTSAAPSQ